VYCGGKSWNSPDGNLPFGLVIICEIFYSNNSVYFHFIYTLVGELHYCFFPQRWIRSLTDYE
jgi:hypothetical protein